MLRLPPSCGMSRYAVVTLVASWAQLRAGIPTRLASIASATIHHVRPAILLTNITSDLLWCNMALTSSSPVLRFLSYRRSRRLGFRRFSCFALALVLCADLFFGLLFLECLELGGQLRDDLLILIKLVNRLVCRLRFDFRFLAAVVRTRCRRRQRTPEQKGQHNACPCKRCQHETLIGRHSHQIPSHHSPLIGPRHRLC